MKQFLAANPKEQTFKEPGRECQGLPRGSQGCLSLGFLVCMPKPVGLSLWACKGIEHLSKTLGSSSQSISDLWHSHGGVL